MKPKKRAEMKGVQLSMAGIQADALIEYLKREIADVYPEKSNTEHYEIMLGVLERAQRILETKKSKL